MDEKKELKIQAQKEEMRGSYSNLMQIIHTKEEFVLDFYLMAPPQGLLVSRVILSPGHLKRMIKALEENVAKYEEKFGKVEEASAPPETIGFNTADNQ